MFSYQIYINLTEKYDSVILRSKLCASSWNMGMISKFAEFLSVEKATNGYNLSIGCR